MSFGIVLTIGFRGCLFIGIVQTIDSAIAH